MKCSAVRMTPADDTGAHWPGLRGPAEGGFERWASPKYIEILGPRERVNIKQDVSREVVHDMPPPALFIDPDNPIVCLDMEGEVRLGFAGLSVIDEKTYTDLVTSDSSLAKTLSTANFLLLPSVQRIKGLARFIVHSLDGSWSEVETVDLLGVGTNLGFAVPVHTLLNSDSNKKSPCPLRLALPGYTAADSLSLIEPIFLDGDGNVISREIGLMRLKELWHSLNPGTKAPITPPKLEPKVFLEVNETWGPAVICSNVSALKDALLRLMSGRRESFCDFEVAIAGSPMPDIDSITKDRGRRLRELNDLLIRNIHRITDCLESPGPTAYFKFRTISDFIALFTVRRGISGDYLLHLGFDKSGYSPGSYVETRGGKINLKDLAQIEGVTYHDLISSIQLHVSPHPKEPFLFPIADVARILNCDPGQAMPQLQAWQGLPGGGALNLNSKRFGVELDLSGVQIIHASTDNFSFLQRTDKRPPGSITGIDIAIRANADMKPRFRIEKVIRNVVDILSEKVQQVN